MFTGISGSKQVLIASQTAFSLNSPAGAAPSSDRAKPSTAPACSLAIRKSPPSVRTVTFPPSVCTMATSWPAASVAGWPAGIAVAGQSLDMRCVMARSSSRSADRDLHRHPGVDPPRVVERAQPGERPLEFVDDLAHEPRFARVQAGGLILPEDLRQRLRKVLRPRVLDHLEVGPEAGLLSRVPDRVVEAAELVHETELLRLGAGPDPPLSYLLDEGRLELSPFGDLGDELAVDPVHHPLQHRHLLLRLWPLDRDRARILAGLHAVEGDAVLVRELLDVELYVEYVDLTRDGSCLRQDALHVGQDPVPARNGVRSHRPDDGLGLSGEAQPPLDRPRPRHAPSGAVHAQHDRLDRRILAQAPDFPRKPRAADLGRIALAVDDVALRVHDGNLAVTRRHGGADRGPGIGAERHLPE